jgi:hypothetical protein
VAGEHLPFLSPRAWESLLAERFVARDAPAFRYRLIRSDGRRAVVEVDQWSAERARTVLAARPRPPGEVTVDPRKTWGTLVGAKEWLRAGRERPTRD